MHHLGRLKETPASAGRYAGHSAGHTRRALIDRAAGSPHQEVVVAELEPGGSVDLHLHAFEEAFYVLDGQLTFEAADATEELGPDDFVFVDRGTAHRLSNASAGIVRWFEVSAPQPGADLEDTVFYEGSAPAPPADPPYWRDHFDVDALPPPSGVILAGFNAANVGNAALRILVGPDSGASQLNLMVVQYHPDGFIAEHDHAFEEGFFFLEGEVEANLDGEIFTLGAGDYCWSSVGSMHALTNKSGGIVRWLETQVPQPPSRYQARFRSDWERFVEGES
jgi:quercetin dioxygenase-like cupin family protein